MEDSVFWYDNDLTVMNRVFLLWKGISTVVAQTSCVSCLTARFLFPQMHELACREMTKHISSLSTLMWKTCFPLCTVDISAFLLSVCYKRKSSFIAVLYPLEVNKCSLQKSELYICSAAFCTSARWAQSAGCIIHIPRCCHDWLW